MWSYKYLVMYDISASLTLKEQKCMTELTHLGVISEPKIANLTIPTNFCVDSKATVDDSTMDTTYLERSYNDPTNLALVLMVNNTIYGVLTFNINESTGHGYIDAFCINQHINTKMRNFFKQHAINGGAMLSLLINALKTSRVFALDLNAIKNAKTIAFYERHQFKKASSSRSSQSLQPMTRRTPSFSPPSSSLSSSSIKTEDALRELSPSSPSSSPSLPFMGNPRRVLDHVDSMVNNEKVMTMYLKREIHRPSYLDENYTEIGYIPVPSNRKSRMRTKTIRHTKYKKAKTIRRHTKYKAKTNRSVRLYNETPL